MSNIEHFLALPQDVFRRKHDCPGCTLSGPGTPADTLVRNWLSEKGIVVETWGRLSVLVTPMPASGKGTGLEAWGASIGVDGELIGRNVLFAAGLTDQLLYHSGRNRKTNDGVGWEIFSFVLTDDDSGPARKIAERVVGFMVGGPYAGARRRVGTGLVQQISALL